MIMSVCHSVSFAAWLTGILTESVVSGADHAGIDTCLLASPALKNFQKSLAIAWDHDQAQLVFEKPSAAFSAIATVL